MQTMTYKALPRVVAVHMALVEERETVVKRLTAINAALKTVNFAPPPVPAKRSGESPIVRAKPSPPPSLIQLVLDFTRSGPKPVVEVLRHLRAKKFKFRTDSPLSELLAAIEKSYEVKDFGGKLGPSDHKVAA